jgi:8-oxo-dGTP pyrophosphatase MutT (NUDIX family)
MSVDRLLLGDRTSLAERLTTVFGNRTLEQDGGRRAAVALVVGEDHGTLGFLLTQRVPRLATHAGQFALPGGRVDEGEEIVDAALRELREELGLVLTRAHVVGRLPDYRTGSGYCIAPIVVWADDVSGVRINPDEVAHAYHIPLRALEGPSVPTLVRAAGAQRPIIQIPLGGDRVIHAPTGAILYQFAEAALHGRYIDAQAYDEPVWARR